MIACSRRCGTSRSRDARGRLRRVAKERRWSRSPETPKPRNTSERFRPLDLESFLQLDVPCFPLTLVLGPPLSSSPVASGQVALSMAQEGEGRSYACHLEPSKPSNKAPAERRRDLRLARFEGTAAKSVQRPGSAPAPSTPSTPGWRQGVVCQAGAEVSLLQRTNQPGTRAHRACQGLGPSWGVTYILYRAPQADTEYGVPKDDARR